MSKNIFLAIPTVVILSFFLVFGIALSATDDFTADGNITVEAVTFGNSTVDMLIFDESTSQSWALSSGTFTVTSPGSAFHVGSSDSSVKSIHISQASVLVCQENNTPGTSYAIAPTTAGTYTITPSTVINCDTIGGGGGPSYSPSSYTPSPASNTGQSTSPPVAVTPAPTPTVTTPVVTPTPTVTATPTVSVFSVFTKTLEKGMDSVDIKRLQQLLNSDPDTAVASSGVGSAGNETNYYGSLTEKAVQKFQAKYSIVSSGSPQTTGYGLIGPKTRIKLQEVFDNTTTNTPAQTVSNPQAQAVSVSSVFSTAMGAGMSNSDIKRLQQLLNSNPDTAVASSGVGSIGNETNYFGSLTEKAVRKFQAKYGIVSSGYPNTTGFGYVGPKTRAKLSEIFGE